MESKHTMEPVESVTISAREYALLRAAPDLLAVAREMAESVSGNLKTARSRSAHAAVYAAIAKAKGE